VTHGFETLAIHAGQEPDPTTGAVVPPIYQTSTYKQDGVGGLRGGYEYSRSANPTRTALEECLAAIEGGHPRAGVRLGLAAEDTLLRTVCRPGDHVVIPDDAYGGTYRLFAKVLAANWGLEHTPVPLRLAAVARRDPPGPDQGGLVSRRRPTRCSASPTSPRSPPSRTTPGRCSSSTTRSPRRTCSSRSRSARTSSCTRRRSTSAATATSSAARWSSPTPTWASELAFHQNAMGAVAGPFDAWLVLRGIKTLGVRMDRHCANAARVVDLLLPPAVVEVRYPGSPMHPGHEVAGRR
jgi:cystathionine gamma-synthase